MITKLTLLWIKFSLIRVYKIGLRFEPVTRMVYLEATVEQIYAAVGAHVTSSASH